jgi:hypothetical protein
MATVTAAQRSRRAPMSVPVRKRPPWREQRLAEAKARELHARRELRLALRRIEGTYALAARRLEELDDYLAAVRGRLRHAGYGKDEAQRPLF